VDAAQKVLVSPMDDSMLYRIFKIHQFGVNTHTASGRTDATMVGLDDDADAALEPIPPGFRPKVDVLVIPDKQTLADCTANSPLFAHVWQALTDVSPRGCWLVVLKPLSATLEAACH